ncbi:hypothetical protein SAMN05216436_11111 [bacterium A37T11]|nr:hypothetical protein SAMN05216436_11111 [bacterium A37T11]
MEITLGLLAKLEACPGKEQELADFLLQGLTLANAEPDTVHWFAFKIGPSTFCIFDTFSKEEGRNAHLTGQLVAQLMAKAPELFHADPSIEFLEIIAAK